MIGTQQNTTFQPARPKPTILIILDGWGVAPDSLGNAITQARTPNFDFFCQNYFCTTLQASGEGVGLPYNEMGNSEVGHLNIGAGRIVYQDLPKINKSIIEGDFFSNPIFLKACQNAIKNKSSLHLIGLLSIGGVHASIDHLYALLEIAKQQQVKKVFVHAILDGRDMKYNSGIKLVEDLEKRMKKIGVGKIATLCGRFWAMDRDNRWDRIEAAYKAMVLGEAEFKGISALKAIQESYNNKIYDEELKPTVLINKNRQPMTQINNSDSVIFFNFRADRARQLTKAFVLPGFEKFDRGPYLKDLYFVSMVQYDKNLPVEIAYPPGTIKEPLAKVISQAGLRQLHIAETEKYAHITYFINGGKEERLEGEDHVLIPSPSVENYAQTPEMSALEIKDRVLKEVSGGKYDFIIINFANTDMVAHTGDLKATIKAVEVIDRCLGEITEAALMTGGAVFITADHGNAEEIIRQQTGEIDKEHSTYPVPFILVNQNYEHREETGETIKLELLTPSGVLADVAPTVLKVMGLEKPEEMTGMSLV